MKELKEKFLKVSSRVKNNINSATTEEAIKNVSVLPFIRNLGYDIFDLQEVFPEYNPSGDLRTNEKVDYCIFKNSTPVMIIECKAKEQNLGNHIRQLFDYFNKVDVRIAILTNGRNYHFFSDIEKPNIMDFEPFWELDITNLKEDDYVLLLALTKEQFNLNDAIKVACNLKYKALINDYLHKEFDNPSDELTKFIMKQIGVNSFRKENVKQFKDIILQEFYNIENSQKFIYKPDDSEPEETKGNSQDNDSKYFILDGERIPIKYYNEILVQTAEWLISKGKLKPADCPISYSSKRKLLSTDTVHYNGKSFFAPRKLSNGLYIETHTNRQTLIKYSKKLLEYFGYDCSILQVPE